ncbi:death-associated protein 1-like [Mytilus californianus]|uniref:death-associated protein 1-like n=1 Tax=Mytilus californianus TaxID=6549 RepID=UPI0022474E10|nr:death-associated protein 1-like [Mytilus californianus]
MSDASQDAELKGGHAPAVKVGGMRVVTHQKNEKVEGATPPPTKEEIEEFGESAPKSDKHHTSVLISGALSKGDKDFPPEAVKAYHDKPLPTHDNRPNQKPQIIHQPNKH